jgi:hypothetical protein
LLCPFASTKGISITKVSIKRVINFIFLIFAKSIKDSNLHIMARPVSRIYLFIWGLLVWTAGCVSDPLDVDVSGIVAEAEIERFDRDLFGIDPGSMENGNDRL